MRTPYWSGHSLGTHCIGGSHCIIIAIVLSGAVFYLCHCRYSLTINGRSGCFCSGAQSNVSWVIVLYLSFLWHWSTFTVHLPSHSSITCLTFHGWCSSILKRRGTLYSEYTNTWYYIDGLPIFWYINFMYGNYWALVSIVLLICFNDIFVTSCLTALCAFQPLHKGLPQCW